MTMDEGQVGTEAVDTGSVVEPAQEVVGGLDELRAKGASESADVPAEKEVSKTPDSQTPAEPAYTPNLKFKVKGEEKEFDEWIRASIKDADTEKKARELMEKYYGFDTIKADRETVKKEFETVKEDAQKLYGILNEATTLAGKPTFENLDTLFSDKLGIPPEAIYKWAVEKANREQNWTPEQRKAYQDSRNLEYQLREKDNEVKQYQTMYQQQQVQQREQEVQNLVSHPEVQELSGLLAERTGDPYALYNEVVKLGKYYAVVEQKDVPPVQLVREIASRAGYRPGTGQSQASISPSAGQAGEQVMNSPKVVQPSQKPTIPNIAAKGGTPVAKKFKSFDELRKRAEELSAE